MKYSSSNPKTFTYLLKMQDLFRDDAVLRMSDIIRRGGNRTLLYHALRNGVLIRVSRGVYCINNGEQVQEPDMFQAVARVRDSVVCLVSALSYYDITTQIPQYTELAIPRTKREPRIEGVKFYKFSDASLQSGLQTIMLNGLPVKITTPEKTIADCFKFRKQLGMDVVLEALKLYRQQMDFRPNELLKQASVCRVANVMYPYLEMVQYLADM